MNDIQIFNNKQFGSIRAITKDGEPWFVAADVCKALEIANNRDAIGRLDEDEKGVALTDTLGGEQEMTTVNEPGLYTLVLGSRKPEAKAFKRWITHDIIPAIRKHGLYATPEAAEAMLNNPNTMITVLQALIREREEKVVLAAKVESDAPKVLFAASVEASHTSILVGELAKLIKQNGVAIGQQRLFQWLRDNGFILKNKNIPTQYSMERGLMEIKETVINMPDGSVSVKQTTKITGKGQTYFVNRFLGPGAEVMV